MLLLSIKCIHPSLHHCASNSSIDFSSLLRIRSQPSQIHAHSLVHLWLGWWTHDTNRNARRNEPNVWLERTNDWTNKWINGRTMRAHCFWRAFVNSERKRKTDEERCETDKCTNNSFCFFLLNFFFNAWFFESKAIFNTNILPLYGRLFFRFR